MIEHFDSAKPEPERCAVCWHVRESHFPEWCNACSYEQRQGITMTPGLWRHTFESREEAKR